MIKLPLLSNIEAILISIVNENPSYAYEIDKVIENRDMRRWARIGVASIYQVLKKLEEKKLVYSKKEQESKMPERNRYYITEHGKTALTETAKKLLSELEWYYLDLNVGLEASDLMTFEEITDCLTKRLAKVQANQARLKEIYMEQDISFKKKIVIKNQLLFRQAEENFLKEFIKELQA